MKKKVLLVLCGLLLTSLTSRALAEELTVSAAASLTNAFTGEVIKKAVIEITD